MVFFLILGGNRLAEILIAGHGRIGKIFSVIDGFLCRFANMGGGFEIRLTETQVNDINAPGFVLARPGRHGQGSGFFDRFDSIGKTIHGYFLMAIGCAKERNKISKLEDGNDRKRVW